MAPREDEEKIAARELGIPFLGRIPLDPRIVASGDEGKPFAAEAEDSEAAGAFSNIVDKILEGSVH